jgi:hypothetical protein
MIARTPPGFKALKTLGKVIAKASSSPLMAILIP